MNIKIGDKLVCKVSIKNSFIFYKDSQYEVINIKYKDEYHNKLTYKPIFGKVCYDIKDENDKEFSIICDYNKNYIDDYEFHYFFYTLQEIRKLKLEKLKNNFLL